MQSFLSTCSHLNQNNRERDEHEHGRRAEDRMVARKGAVLRTLPGRTGSRTSSRRREKKWPRSSSRRAERKRDSFGGVETSWIERSGLAYRQGLPPSFSNSNNGVGVNPSPILKGDSCPSSYGENSLTAALCTWWSKRIGGGGGREDPSHDFHGFDWGRY